MTAPIVPVIIAAAAATERRMLERLQAAGADSPERAADEATLGFGSGERGALERYRKRGIVRAREDGALWLDAAALEAYRTSMRASARKVVLVLLVLALALLGALLLVPLLVRPDAPPPPI